MIEISLNRLLVFLFFFGYFALLASFFTGYIWNIEPCKLCILQRIPYIFLVIASIVGLFTPLKIVSLRIISSMSFYWFFLASYHALIQFGFINDPCLINLKFKDISSFSSMLQSQIPCSKITWSISKLPICILIAFYPYH